MQKFRLFTSNSVLIGLLLMFTLSFSSCEKVLDEITYTITINNNSTENLELWLQVDGSAFEKSTEVASGESTSSSFFVANAEYVYEARQSDGSVYQTKTFKQSDQTDQVWDIN